MSRISHVSSLSFKKQVLYEDSDRCTNWSSIYICSLINFLGTASFSALTSSQWPYLEKVDKSATESFFGYIVAGSGLASCVSSIIFGYWSNRIQQTRIPILIGNIFSLIGNITYLLIEIVPNNRKFIMLLARILAGIGSGNATLMRAYAPIASIEKDRSRAIAMASGGGALGTTCGSALQISFAFLPHPGYYIFGNFNISVYSSPAILACLCNLTSIFVILTFFKECCVGLINDDETNKDNPIKLPPYDKVAVGILNFSRFTQTFTSTNIETVGGPFSMVMFGWTNEEAVTYISISKMAESGVCLSSYLAYVIFQLNRFIDNRYGSIISLLSLVLFHLLTFSWWFLPGSLIIYNNEEKLNSTLGVIGCNASQFSWCYSIRPVNVWLYYVSQVVLIGITFPIFNIILNTLLSEVVGPRRQGTLQGAMQLSGGFAKTIGPILMSTLYMAFGPRVAWLMEIVTIMVNLIIWLVFHNRMVPLIPKKKKLKECSVPNSPIQH